MSVLEVFCLLRVRGMKGWRVTGNRYDGLRTELKGFWNTRFPEVTGLILYVSYEKVDIGTSGETVWTETTDVRS